MQRWISPAGDRVRLWLAALLAVSAICGFGSQVRAAQDGVVIGDSLGVGVSMASGLTRLARNSVAIRGGGVLGQLKQAPSGAVVFMSLGTNDAVGRIEGLDGDIGRIINAAVESGVKLVWIGPPCVSKSWDTNAQKLDGIIRAKTSGTPVTYVSMRDASMCDSGVRAKDGVHFTMSGYGLMWAKARTAIGFEGGSSKTMVASVSPSRKAARKRRARRKNRALVAKLDGKPPSESRPAEATPPSRAKAANAER